MLTAYPGSVAIPNSFFLYPSSLLQRGLRLLDRCGTEDLCASLYEFWINDSEFSVVYPSQYHSEPNLPSPHCHSRSVDDSCVTRSCSFTNGALINPRLSTISKDNRDSVITHSLLNYPAKSRSGHKSCLVDYLLACSYCGTSFLVQNPAHEYGNSNSPQFLLVPSTKGASSNLTLMNPEPFATLYNTRRPPCNSGLEWRRGRSDKLVLLLTAGTIGLKGSPTLVSKLLTGRFLGGPNEWRSVWPHNHFTRTLNQSQNGKSLEFELIRWFSAWISCGAVPVLVQLSDGVSSGTGQNSSNRSSCDYDETCTVHCSSELTWSYRLVYGVTGNSKFIIIVLLLFLSFVGSCKL